MSGKPSSGFTLLEILVVITLIIILSIIGVFTFRSVSAKAKDSKRLADINAIAKAYEARYLSNNNQYLALPATDIIGGIPKDPDGTTDYYNAIASDGSGFKVCAALQANPNKTCDTQSSTCYCQFSSLSSISSTASLINLGGVVPSPTPTPLPPTPTSTPAPTPTSTPSPTPTNTPTPSPTPGPDPSLAVGLISYWNMNNSASVQDPIGGNNGTLTGTTFVSTGKINGARDFDGSSYITTGNTGMPAYNVSKSVGAWIKTTDSSVMNIFDTSAVNLSFSGSYNGFGTGGPGCGTNGVISSSGNWKYVVVTEDASLGGVNNTKLYVNGTLVKTCSENRTTASTTPIIGRKSTTATNYWIGSLDEIGVWNRVLTANEVSRLYNCGMGNQYPFVTASNPLCGGLAAYFKFDETHTWDTIVDSAGLNSASSAAPITTSGQKLGSAARSLGTISSDYMTIFDSSALQIIGDLSIQVWVYPTSADFSSAQEILLKGGGCGNESYALRLNANGAGSTTTTASLLLNNSGAIATSAPNAITRNAWNHIVVTYNRSSVKVYVNGSPSGTPVSYSSNLPTTLGYNLMLAYGYCSPRYKGYIDELAIWSRALGDTEVLQLYNSAAGQVIAAVGNNNGDVAGVSTSIEPSLWDHLNSFIQSLIGP